MGFLVVFFTVVLLGLSEVYAQNVMQEGQLALNCTTERVTIRVSTSYLKNLSVSEVDSLMLVNANKTSFDNAQCTQNTFSGGYYQFDLLLLQCASSITTDDDNLYASYTVRVMPNFSGQTTSRDASVYFNLFCHFRRQVNSSADEVVNPQVTQRRLHVQPELGGDVQLQMARYTNGSFSSRSSVWNAFDNDLVYIGLSLNADDRFNLILQGQQCWATPDSNINNPIRYSIISNGCAENDPFIENANEVYKNFNDTWVLFSFTVFHWTGLPLANQQMYIHCTVNVCDQSEAANVCNHYSCGKRKRRNILSSASRDQMETISWGPIFLENNDLKEKDETNNEMCSKDELACAYDCAVDNFGNAMCYCPEGMISEDNGKLCKENPVNFKFAGLRIFLLSTSLMEDAVIVTVGIFLFAAIVSLIAHNMLKKGTEFA
ncbi:alpha-tectorin-like [Clavelina lepadiformis]|uniref:alpha-tectorin-like n=1 Tax=Clavelina lepadiformis TaxID=159417 RepID=UPI0040419986